MRALQLVYFMAPAYVANMLPPFMAHWRGWNPPISERWLGSHKTVLGFALGVLGGVTATYLQAQIGWGGAIAVEPGWLELGFRFGIGVMGGDAVKSLFKRRAGIGPGRPWIPDRLRRRRAGARLDRSGPHPVGRAADPARDSGAFPGPGRAHRAPAARPGGPLRRRGR